MTYDAWMIWINGPVGRTLRVLLGLGMFATAYAVGGTGGIVIGVLGIVPMVYGSIGLCHISQFIRWATLSIQGQRSTESR